MSGFGDLSTGAKIFTAFTVAYLVLIFPAAMILLSQWAFIVYSILAGVFLIVILPTALILYKIYWDGQKFLAAQISNQPFNNFSETISKLRDYTSNENEERRFPMFKGVFFDKLFAAKNIFITSTILGIIFLLIPLIWAEFLWPLFYLALILPYKAYRGIYVEWVMLENVRNQQISRIYEILKPIMKFEVPAQYCIMVAAWEDKTIPKQINIVYPSTFRGDTQQARDSFESAFSSTITEDNAWIYTWYPTKSAVVCRPVEDIPKHVEYKGSQMFEWHTFPIGVGLGDKGQEIISYSVSKNKSGVYHPHVLIAGTTGSGKSVIQRNILFHCIQHNDMWRFVGIDLKKVELGKYEKYSETVKSIATTLEDGVGILRYAHQVMSRRYDRMREAGVNLFLDLVDEETGKPDPALLVMIDEAYEFLAPSGNKTAQGKYEDELHQEAGYLLSSIARLGRAAGIHLVLATQRPDATVIKGELKNNLDVRIAAGRLDNTPSLMVLDSAAATTLPDIKGRGMIRLASKTRQFQGFYANEDWIDNWLAKPQNRHHEPALTAKMFGSVESKSAPVRVASPEKTAPANVPKDILEQFVETVTPEGTDYPELPPSPVFTTQEDVDNFLEGEEIPAIDETMLEPDYMFDDELSLVEDDDITDEEIEELLNELARIEESEDSTVAPVNIEYSEQRETSENVELLFEQAEKAFEIEFQNLFNEGVQKPIPDIVETITVNKKAKPGKINLEETKPKIPTPPRRLIKPTTTIEEKTEEVNEGSELKEKIKKIPLPTSNKNLTKKEMPKPKIEPLPNKTKNGFPIPEKPLELNVKENPQEEQAIIKKEIPKPPTLKL